MFCINIFNRRCWFFAFVFYPHLLFSKWDSGMFSYCHSFSGQIRSSWNFSTLAHIFSHMQPRISKVSQQTLFLPQLSVLSQGATSLCSLCEGSEALRRFRAARAQQDSALVSVLQTSEELRGAFDLRKWIKAKSGRGPSGETPRKEGIWKC